MKEGKISKDEAETIKKKFVDAGCQRRSEVNAAVSCLAVSYRLPTEFGTGADGMDRHMARLLLSFDVGDFPVRSKLVGPSEPACDSIPIGDCDFRILELQLQFGQNCKEGIFARFPARNLHAEFVCPYFFIRSHRTHTNSDSCPFFDSDALRGIISRSAIGCFSLFIA